MYVDDMRLLKNSINEFKIYDQKMNDEDYKEKEKIRLPKNGEKTSRDRNKIFALVLYKNLYPRDFADLIRNQGELYNIFPKKKKIAKENTMKIEVKIPPLEKKIEELKNEKLSNVENLRVLYVAKILSKKPEEGYVGNVYDYISDEKFAELRRRESFDYVEQNIYGRFSNRSQYFHFSDVEKEVDPYHIYDQREKMIVDSTNGEIDKLESQILDYKNEISEMEQKSIKDLLQEFPEIDFVSDIESPSKKEFVDYLLRRGYIDEDYSRYISYFYADSLSENDKRFLRLIKNNQAPNNFFLELSNFENIVKRILGYEWRHFAILNHSLLGYLLQKKERHLDSFLMTLWKYKKENRNCTFLSDFGGNRNFCQILYNEIYRLFNDKKDWMQILFEKESKSVLYKFFKYADFEKAREDIVNYLSKDVSYLYDSEVVGDEKLIAAKLALLGLKFNLLNNTPDCPIYDILLNCNAYVVSKQNFNVIINHSLKRGAQEPIVDYYTQISNLPNDKIKSYVKENIEEFVKNVVLSTETLTEENEDAFVELLNSEKLSHDTKVKLIEKNKCYISDLAKIKLAKSKSTDKKQMDLYDLLFVCGRIKPLWKNVIENFKYHGKELNKCLNDYLNDSSVVDEIVKSEFLSQEELKNKSGNCETARWFYQGLLAVEGLSLESFSKLMDACPWKMNDFSLYGVSPEKMDCLIELNKIEFTPEKYNVIENGYVTLLPKYISKNFNRFIDVRRELSVSFETMKLLLDSKELNNDAKKRLLSMDFNAWDEMRAYNGDYKWLGEKVVELEYSENLSASVEKIAKDLDDVLILKKFITLQEPNLKNNEIEEIVMSEMPEPYSLCVSRNDEKVKIPNTPENLAFVSALKKKDLIVGFKQGKNEITVTQKEPIQ